MHESRARELSGAALTVEGGIIAVLASNLLSLTTGWEWDWIFNVALGVLIFLFVVRAVSTLADNPHFGRIRYTIPLSTVCLQLCIVGAATSSAVRLVSVHPIFQSTVLNFVLITNTAVISVIIIDEIFLGEFISTWIGVIHDVSGDNPVGELLRETGDWAEGAIDSWNSDSDSTKSVSYVRGVKLLILLVSIFAVLSAPLWYLGSGVLGSTWAAFLVLFMLILIRDQSRYLYFRFGIARSFSEVKTSTPTTLLVLLTNLAIVAGALGVQV